MSQILSDEDVRNAGGIVHRDGNVFFTNIDKLNAAILAKLADRQQPMAQPEQPAVPDSTYESVCSKIVGRYVVEKRTGGGFWPYCVRAVGGSMELFIGQKNKCDEVAQALQTACLDGAFMMKESVAPGRISEDWTSTDHYNDGWNDCRDAMLASAPPARQAEDDSSASVNDTNAALAARYFELLKVVEQYEKSGVTCQTYRHFIAEPCAECNSPGTCGKQASVVRQEPVVQGEPVPLARYALAMLVNPDNLEPWQLELYNRAMLAAVQQPAAQDEQTDSMGIPPCGGPLCAPGDHHPLCSLAAAQNPPRVPRFPRLALRKLADLQGRGHLICGVMIQRAEPDGRITRGAVSNGGMVIWWHPEQASTLYEELRAAIDAGSETAAHADALAWVKKAHQVLADVHGLTLTDEQCDAFRRLPMPFNDMVRAIHAAGAEHRTEPGPPSGRSGLVLHPHQQEALDKLTGMKAISLP